MRAWVEPGSRRRSDRAGQPLFCSNHALSFPNHLAQTQSAKKDSQECPIVEKERSYGTLKKAISARPGADGALSRTAEHKPRSLCRTYRHLHQGAFSTFVHGSMPVTQDIALRLARSLNTTPGLWLNMQKSVALRIANHEKQGLTAPSGQVSLQGKTEKGEGRDGLFPATTGDCLGSEECEVGIVRGRAAKGNFGSSPKPPSAACTASIAVCPWSRMESQAQRKNGDSLAGGRRFSGNTCLDAGTLFCALCDWRSSVVVRVS